MTMTTSPWHTRATFAAAPKPVVTPQPISTATLSGTPESIDTTWISEAVMYVGAEKDGRFDLHTAHLW
jgi:hypothetical protein